jgi:hypothetical protein
MNTDKCQCSCPPFLLLVCIELIMVGMSQKELQPAESLSQLAVASFVFGVIQATITGILLFVATMVSSALSNYGLDTIRPTVVSSSNTELLPLLLGNIWGLFGILTGVVGLFSVRAGKTGAGLAFIGLFFSTICLMLTIVPVFLR